MLLRLTVVLLACFMPVGLVMADDGDALDRELLESLEGPPPAGSIGQIVPRLIDGTKAAAARLQEGQFGDETTKLQTQILADLDALLEQTPPPGQPPQSPSADPQPQNQPQNQQQQAQSQQSQSQDQSGSSKDGQSDPNAAAKESEERSTSGRETAGERERRLGLSTAAWGHLPPKVREQMRSAFSEEYLPEYDALVRRYYEALARRRE